jgi:hypothetical protein
MFVFADAMAIVRASFSASKACTAALMHGLIDQRHVEPHHAVAHLLQRLDRTTQQEQFVPDVVNPLHIWLIGGAGKDCFLQ